MKKKKILIAYMRNGDFKKTIDKELLHKSIVKELEDEGYEVYTTFSTLDILRTTFQDGSSVSSCGYGAHLRGDKFTHIYIDKDLKEANKNFLNEVNNFSLMFEANDSWDVSGDRTFTYEVNNGIISVEKY